MFIRAWLRDRFRHSRPRPHAAAAVTRCRTGTPTCASRTGCAITPDVPVTEFLDSFGNRCTRIVAPAGTLRLCNDFIIEDPGVVLPLRLRRGPALRRRTCRPSACRSCSPAATASRTGCPTPPGTCSGTARPDWARVQAVCDWVLRQRRVRLPVRPQDQDRLRRLRGAQGRLPRLHAPGHHLLPRPEHPGPLRDRLSGRHRRSRRTSTRWTSAPASRSIWAASGTCSTPAMTSAASAGS